MANKKLDELKKAITEPEISPTELQDLEELNLFLADLENIKNNLQKVLENQKLILELLPKKEIWKIKDMEMFKQKFNTAWKKSNWFRNAAQTTGDLKKITEWDTDKLKNIWLAMFNTLNGKQAHRNNPTEFRELSSLIFTITNSKEQAENLVTDAPPSPLEEI